MNWMSSLWNVTICLYFFILRPRLFLLALVSFPLFAAINTSLSFRLNPSTFTGVPSTLLVYLCHETINCTFFPPLPPPLVAVKILFPSGKHGRLKLTLQAPYNAPHWRVVPPRAFRITVLKPMFTYSRYFVRKSFLTKVLPDNARKKCCADKSRNTRARTFLVKAK